MKNKRIISIFELTLIVMSSFAFAYFVSTDLPDVFEKQSSVIQYLARPIIPVVSASDTTPSGCCKETVSGATCQEVILEDKALCKTDLVGTSCNVVSECQKGCCYDSDSGICSLNAPQEKCIENGGEWDPSTTCNIQQCQMGCCILGDGAAMMTTRECTQTAKDYKIEKVFKPLDNKGTCDAYSDPTDMGACLFKSDDYSGKMNCIFTTKSKCVNSGRDFKRDYLCTSKELNTTCEKTTKTTCVDGDDRVYFVDSCGNKANVYDSRKANENSYWEKIILPKDSCSGSAESCGNCDYTTGSICTKYISGSEITKPEIGEYVCKNLNCVNGKKHGDSWCVSDMEKVSNNGGYSVGSRSYVASCFEGEIKLEGCADFNQEICIEMKDSSSGNTEASCTVNDWRSCIYANDYNHYDLIKAKCKTLPQCVMFNDIPGNEKYKDLPGFKEGISNDAQGKAGSVGDGMNLYVMQCMPRFTPGYQFWTSTYGSSKSSNANYGGSKAESNAICGLATFSCVSHILTTTPMVNPTPHDKENPECNMQAVSQSNQKVSLMMEGLNERCRMIGSCGIQYNTQGELGNEGFNVSRIYVDKKGKSHTGYTTNGYVIPKNYSNESLKENQKSVKFGDIEKLSEIAAGKGAVYTFETNSINTATVGNDSQGQSSSTVASEAQRAVGSADGGDPVMDYDPTLALGTAALAGVGSYMALSNMVYVTASVTTYVVPTIYGPTGEIIGTTMSSTTTYGATTSSSLLSIGSSLGLAALTIVAQVAGAYIGQMIAKSAGMTPGETVAFVGMVSSFVAAAAIGTTMAVAMTGTGGVALTAGFGSIAVGAATAGAASGSAVTGFASFICAIPILCLAVIVIMIAYIIYSLFSGEDHEYFITRFECKAWQPPLIGKCEECNKDVRPCSEYKCRSIGSNCRYYTENGEPGYCATMNDVWSAKISPWNEKLTSGNKYTNITNAGFRIVGEDKNSKEVEAWKSVRFGIITDEQAVCKIDTNHSKKFEEMKYTLVSDKNYATGKVDGQHHWITLSPHVVFGESEIDEGSSTPPLEEGENEYYVICQNFAGMTNGAPFIVQVKQKEGPDLTPAEATRTIPEDKSYLAYGAKNTSFWIYLDEPAECKYSIDYDYNFYDEMPYNFTCLTGGSEGFYGEWPCMALLPSIGQTTKIYVKCKDQPGLVEDGGKIYKRNENRVSFQYDFSVCQTGLEITSVTPTGIVEVNSSQEISLEVRTAGCINEGESDCWYKLPYYGDGYSAFLNTGASVHRQPLVNLGSGDRTVDIECIDRAGNSANASINFTIFYDDYAPGIIRIFEENEKIVLETTEEANCAINLNETKQCDFKITESSDYVTKHSITLSDKNKKQTLYIRCEDRKGNMPNGCTEIIKMVDLQRGK